MGRESASFNTVCQVFKPPQWAITEGDSDNDVVAIVTDLHYGSVFALRRSSIGMWSAVTSSVVGRHFEVGAARIESPSLPILERLLETVGVEQTRYSKDTPRSFCPGCGGIILHPEAGIGECASCQAKAVIVYTIRG